MATTRYVAVVKDRTATGDFELDAFTDISDALGYMGEGIIGHETPTELLEAMKGVENDPEWKDYKVMKITIEFVA